MAALNLDARGRECPEPLEMAVAMMGDMKPGDVLTVLSTDPASEIDFEAWCARKSHEYLGVVQSDGVWKIRIAIR